MIQSSARSAERPKLSEGAVIFITEGDPGSIAAFQKRFPNHPIEAIRGVFDVEAIRDKHEIEILSVTARSHVSQGDMAAIPNLRLIASASTGFDHVDVAEARRLGIGVTYVPEYGPAVAEFSIALVLSLARKIHIAARRTMRDDFSLGGLLGTNIGGKTLGVVGTGNVGMRVARFAAGLDMCVVAYDPYPSHAEAHRIGFTYVGFDELLKVSDVITLCCPLVPETRHLIGKPQFRLMKKGALLVNTSRGPVVDTDALIWALDRDILAGAALDVTEGETMQIRDLSDPLSEDLPMAERSQAVPGNLALVHHPKVLITPHMAYYSKESMDTIPEISAENALRFFEGEPQNLV